LSADDHDQAVRRSDPDRWLASRFIADVSARADVIVLLAFDQELERAGRVASNSLVAEIRLTWWREAVDEIFSGRGVRGEPVARALDVCVKRRALPRAPLEAMVDARILALERRVSTLAEATAWADGAAGSAAVLSARILDPAAPPDAPARAGRAIGLRRLAREGRVGVDIVRYPIVLALDEANRAATTLSVAAFPAIAAATLARAETLTSLGARARLLLAVVRGRL